MRRTKEAIVCTEISKMLKDAQGDLAIISDGRGTDVRFRALSDLLHNAQEKLRSIDPFWVRLDREMAEKELKTLRLTHVAGEVG